MDCYSNAQEWYNGSKIMADSGEYRLAVYHCCMAVELYLKSRLPEDARYCRATIAGGCLIIQLHSVTTME